MALAAAGITIAFKTKPLLKLACGGALLLTLGILTWQQAGIYRDQETLWHDTLAKNPNCWMAHDNLGDYLYDKGRNREAEEHYRKAIEVDSNNPYNVIVQNNLGNTLAAQGRLDEAIEAYRQAIRSDPNFSPALNNLAWILASASRTELRNGAEAVQVAERACDLTQHRAPLFMGTLAAAYAEAGRFPEAVATAEEAEQLATDVGLAAVAEKNRKLLELYRTGKPYREPVPTTH